jgi:molybdate transport system substrate-binding protein
MRRFTLLLPALMLIVTLLISGCGNGAAPSSVSDVSPANTANSSLRSSENEEVTVYAAASLTEAFQDIAQSFSSKNGGAQVVFNFGGSSQLRSQIEEGAPAGVFAPANTKEMDTLIREGLISSGPAIFARNRLVVIIPQANPGKIQRLQDLARDGVRFVAAGPSVPAGAYSLQVLDRMSADPAYGAGFKDKVTNNFISQETDVKQVVAKIQLGEGDAGMVYLTDVTPKVAPDVQVLEIPDSLNVVAEYPIALVKDAKESKLGQAFVSFVLSDEGQAILKKHNFLPGN